MEQSTINNIKKMLDDYNNLKARIKELELQNNQLCEMYKALDCFEMSENIEIAKTALNDEILLNLQYINEYTQQLDNFNDAIERLYNENRDYKTELRQDAMNTFKRMIDNATSDYQNGYSFEVFKRQNDHANDWLAKRMAYLDGIIDNPTAFATMINLGLGSLD